MKYIPLVWSLLAAQTSFAAEQFIAEVGAEFWASPRNGEAIIHYEPIAIVVDKLLVEPDAYLILRHPEGESGELWGVELQAWLVSLGLVSDRIELQPGYEGIDGVGLYIESPDIDVEVAEPLIDIEAVEPLVDIDVAEPLVDIEVVVDEVENIPADVVEQEEVEPQL
jgi:hypothetical protein